MSLCVGIFSEMKITELLTCQGAHHEQRRAKLDKLIQSAVCLRVLGVVLKEKFLRQSSFRCQASLSLEKFDQEPELNNGA